jgi:hypothetical protein
LVGFADHCTCPSATVPLGDTSFPWNGSTAPETCGTDLSLAMAVWIAVLTVGAVTFAPPSVVANTIVLWPPPNAGSLADSTFAAFCASVPGMVKLSFVFPPLS